VERILFLKCLLNRRILWLQDSKINVITKLSNLVRTKKLSGHPSVMLHLFFHMLLFEILFLYLLMASQGLL
jgi:hypothetical protein